MRCAWLLLMFIVLPGCWSHQAARPREGVVAAIQDRDDAIWPARDTVRLRELMDRTPREVYTLRARDGVSTEALAEEDREVLKPTTEVVYKGVHARNLLRLTKKPEATGSAARFGYHFTGFNPNGFLISSRTLENIERRRLIEAKLRPPVTQPKRSSPEELAKIKFELVDNTALHLEDGLPVCIPDPRDGWKGVLIHLQSLGANDYEPRVLDEFRRRGWAVIDIKPQSFIPSPIPEGWYEEIRSLRAEYQSLSAELFQAPPGATAFNGADSARRHPNYPRFIEVEKRLGKLNRGGFQACDDVDHARTAAEIASQVDQGMAGAAYAVESILDYIDTRRPDLHGLPTAVMGFSAGALATPTAVARIEAMQPGRIGAVVVIAGGCNLLRIARESSFSDGGLKVLCGEEPVSKQVERQLFDLYLGASRLDPYHTAALIRHLPVLQVHASRDTWVPAGTGELLYERLGGPERLVFSGDHDILFYMLPQKSRWIADWVERAVKPAPSRSVRAASEQAAR